MWESKTLPEYLILFPPFFLGEGMCVGVSPPVSLAGGDTPTHAYPHAQAPARQSQTIVALLLDITRPGCRGIRVAWYYTIDPCVAMPRGRHG